MYRVINIRGTNASGKSYLVRSLMRDYGAKQIRATDPTDLLGIGGSIEGYKVNYKGAPFYIVGRYSYKKGGGCDLIKTQDEICDRVRRYWKLGNVIFEGFVVSGLYRKRYYPLSREVGGFIWVFLDTPLEVCLQRLKERDGKEFDDLSYRNVKKETEEEAVARWKTGVFRSNTFMEAKYKAVLSARQHAIEDGEFVVDIDHRQALKEFYLLLDTLT